MDESVTIEGRFVRETDRAVLYFLDDFEEQHWIPRSQVLDEDRDEEGGFVEVTQWFYDKLEAAA